MRYVGSKSIDEMRKDISDRYGPIIHGDLVSEMSSGRILKIFITMNKIGPEDFTKNEDRQIPGQLSLFS